MMVAIPVWGGRISPVFDAAKRLMVVKVERGKEIHRREVSLPVESQQHRVGRMANLGVDVLICGGISRSCADLMEGLNIRIVPWVSGEPDQVLVAYITGELPCSRFAMPGH